MILIVGLGNPGIEYKKTPHNMGFRVLDFFAHTYIPHEKWKNEGASELIETTIESDQVLLQKPCTYMNNSGNAVKEIIKKYRIEDTTHCWVIHDDLDLSWGRVKIEKEKNAAGHKGVQSIIDALGTNNFWRFRVGIKPDPYPLEKEDIDAYLTKESVSPSKCLLEIIMFKQIAHLISTSIKEGITKGDFFFTIND